jgi:magnesium-protoporphyrin O-methyltransferase
LAGSADAGPIHATASNIANVGGRLGAWVADVMLLVFGGAAWVWVLAGLSARTDVSLAFTFAPRTALLSVMHAAGRFFPRGDRAPSIVPVADAALRGLIGRDPGLKDFTVGEDCRIASGFYTSHAMELRRR